MVKAYMERLRKDVYTEGKWRLKQCCCCCDLRTGTTVLGVLAIIGTFAQICFPSVDTVSQTEPENEAAKNLKRIVLTIIRLVSLGTIGSMVYGNIKGITRLMIPYLYIALLIISLTIVVAFIESLFFMFTGNFLIGLLTFFVNGVLNSAISLYYWHVIRCRTLDIDEMDQPSGIQGAMTSHQDPEAPPPPYENAPLNSGVAQNIYEKPGGELTAVYANSAIN